MSENGRSISLVLGSGGARGLAHIGVIEALEQADLRIESIAGCSMGALVGGVHAMDRLEIYREWVCALERMDVLRLLDFSFGRAGLIKGNKLIGVLKELIGDAAIEDLPIDFTAVAMDIDRHREVWLTKGSLFDAIRASIAVPTLFTPHTIKGQRLVDGGLLNPIPIAPTLQDQTDFTVAVNLAGHHDPSLSRRREEDESSDDDVSGYRAKIAAFVESVAERFSGEDEDQDEGLGLLEVVNRSFDAMQNTIARIKLATHAPDLVIDIPRNACLTYEYWRGQELIDLGRERAEAAVTRFLEERENGG